MRRKEQSGNEAEDVLLVTVHHWFCRAVCRVSSLGGGARGHPYAAFRPAALCQSHQRLFRAGRYRLRDCAVAIRGLRVRPIAETAKAILPIFRRA